MLEAVDEGVTLRQTCREAVLDAFDQLKRQEGRDIFELWEIVEEVQQSTDKFAKTTIRTHVVSLMCVQAPANHATRYADLDRVGHGLYRRRR